MDRLNWNLEPDHTDGRRTPPLGPHAAPVDQTRWLALLASGASGDTVCRAITATRITGQSVIATTLFIIDRHTNGIVAVGAHGWPEESSVRYRNITLDTDIPTALVARVGIPAVVPMRDLGDLFPLTATVTRRLQKTLVGYSNADLLTCPVTYGGVVTGVLSLVAGESVTNSWYARASLDSVLHSLALWIQIHLEQHNHRPQPRALKPGTRIQDLTFTDRQLAILDLVKDGATNVTISDTLGVSVATVKHEIAAMSELVGATNRTDLLRRAYAAKLLPDRRQ